MIPCSCIGRSGARVRRDMAIGLECSGEQGVNLRASHLVATSGNVPAAYGDYELNNLIELYVSGQQALVLDHVSQSSYAMVWIRVVHFPDH